MDRTLSKAALKVLIALCGHADSNDLCYPTQVRIAQVSCLSRQHVNKALKELCNRGWVILVGKRRGRGRWPRNIYRINFAKVDKGQEAMQSCHPRGDTRQVTTEVTLSSRPTGDTNKSINKKYNNQNSSQRLTSPYQMLVKTLSHAGLSQEQVDSLILEIDPEVYEKFCLDVNRSPQSSDAVIRILDEIGLQIHD